VSEDAEMLKNVDFDWLAMHLPVHSISYPTAVPNL